MKRYQFIEYIQNPDSLNEQSLSELKETIEEFPYFQAARMLWTKNLHLLEHISLNNELKITAAHISDRKKLFFLLNNFDFGTSNENVIQEERPETKKDVLSDLLEYEKNNAYYDFSSLLKKDKKLDKNTKMALIDNFLQQHNIEKIKVKDVNEKENEDFSVKSSQENDELMTETLANIYINQNQFLKARNIFEKLSLKYPEKSIYFAARIKEVEKHINNLK
jgi:hypothetical protein